MILCVQALGHKNWCDHIDKPQAFHAYIYVTEPMPHLPTMALVSFCGWSGSTWVAPVIALCVTMLDRRGDGTLGSLCLLSPKLWSGALPLLIYGCHLSIL